CAAGDSGDGIESAEPTPERVQPPAAGSSKCPVISIHEPIGSDPTDGWPRTSNGPSTPAGPSDPNIATVAVSASQGGVPVDGNVLFSSLRRVTGPSVIGRSPKQSRRSAE